jgi:mono/diheme cytochrome c family protein
LRLRCWHIIAALIAVPAIGAAVVIRAGWYDVGALEQHWQATFAALELTKRYSVRHHARDIAAPTLTQALVQRGVVVYRQQCQQCHGAPGIAPEGIGLGMQPLPGPLVHMTQKWTPAEIYWIVAHGIKMSGMPAWRYRLSEQDMWAVTALVTRLPALSPQEYAALQDSANEQPLPQAAPELQRASIGRGRLALPQYACQSCHRIPGIPGAQVQVGPALDNYARRQYVAGYLPNTPENLARWLRATHEVKPLSAMPPLGVSAQDAADMAAYLLADDENR